MNSELKEFLLNEYSYLTARREELVEELNIIEGQLTEIDRVINVMGAKFKTTLEEKI